MTTQYRAPVGLRTVAAFEATKGLIVMLAGLGMLSLLHHDVQRAAEAVVLHLHLNPARQYPRVFLQAAARLTDTRLWLLAGGAFAYAAARVVEAYGLWRARSWAQWLAILSGGIYLPFELYELFQHATTLKAFVLLINAGIVAYVICVRLVSPSARDRRRSGANRHRQPM